MCLGYPEIAWIKARSCNNRRSLSGRFFFFRFECFSFQTVSPVRQQRRALVSLQRKHRYRQSEALLSAWRHLCEGWFRPSDTNCGKPHEHAFVRVLYNPIQVVTRWSPGWSQGGHEEMRLFRKVCSVGSYCR